MSRLLRKIEAAIKPTVDEILEFYPDTAKDAQGKLIELAIILGEVTLEKRNWFPKAAEFFEWMNQELIKSGRKKDKAAVIKFVKECIPKLQEAVRDTTAKAKEYGLLAADKFHAWSDSGTALKNIEARGNNESSVYDVVYKQLYGQLQVAGGNPARMKRAKDESRLLRRQASDEDTVTENDDEANCGDICFRTNMKRLPKRLA